MSLLYMLFRKLMGLSAATGFMLVMTLDPDVPGAEMTTTQMLTAYTVFGSMIVVPMLLNWLLGWGWFRPEPPPSRAMHWWSDHR